MRFNRSMVVFAFSWVAFVFAVIATVCWVGIVVAGNYCWSAFAFTMTVTPVNVAILVLAVIPGSIFYFRTRQRKDLTTLWLTGCSCLFVLVETALLWIIPMRGE